MKVLVTGGAGFVGSHITDRFLSEGHDVLVHCAAQASVYASVNDPWSDAYTNILGGINVCLAAMNSRCGRFIYITTGGALYGNPEYLPCDEAHPVKPISGYGLSKWTLESYLSLLVPDSVNLGVMRLANVYGPRQDPAGEAGVVAIFIKLMLSNERVTIFGDGDQTRDFIYVGDVAEACSLVLDTPKSLVVNVGTGVATSVNDLFSKIACYTGYKMSPHYESERDGDVRHIHLDSSRAQGALGWVAGTRLDDGLRQTIKSIERSIGRCDPSC